MWKAGLDEAQARIKIAMRNVNNLSHTDDIVLMTESEELKSHLMKVKQDSEKAGLKFNIQKAKIMASSPITSWQIEGGKNRNSDRLFWRGGAPKSLQTVTTVMKLKDTCSLEGKLWQTYTAC